MTAPHPEGLGALKVMQNCLEDAELTINDVDVINVHGTSTPLGDIAETKAIKDLFGEHAYNLNISQKNFYKLFGKKLEDIFKFELYWGKKLKYLKRYKDGYKLSDKGAYIFHLVEQSYTNQYIDKTWRTSLKNPWPKRITLY
jgi:hypothetical protein